LKWSRDLKNKKIIIVIIKIKKIVKKKVKNSLRRGLAEIQSAQGIPKYRQF